MTAADIFFTRNLQYVGSLIKVYDVHPGFIVVKYGELDFIGTLNYRLTYASQSACRLGTGLTPLLSSNNGSQRCQYTVK
jgi:hypothetical protein